MLFLRKKRRKNFLVKKIQEKFSIIWYKNKKKDLVEFGVNQNN